jgi:AbrB family looped-hinge helix DNA binding protein
MSKIKQIIKPFKLSKGGGEKVNYHWRVLIPKDYWEMMELKEGDNVEISINDEKVIQIRKVEIK